MSHKRCQERHPTKFATMSKNGLSYFTHGESPKPWTAQNALTWKGNQFIQHYHMLHFQNFLSYLYCGCNEMTMIMEIIMTTKTRILPLSQKWQQALSIQKLTTEKSAPVSTHLFFYWNWQKTIHVPRSRHKHAAVKFAHVTAARERYCLLLLLVQYAANYR